jgi:DNA polymerase-4
MRRPTEIERLYLDFDGFFASVEQQARPRLRGRPVGVVPFEGAGERGILIACSREAKCAGVKNVMDAAEARAICSDLVLVPQSPDLYRRAHNALISEIIAVIPVDAVKSIDELTCTVAPADRADPLALGRCIKQRIAENVGPYITCSIGFAANRQLAKMACKAGKKSEGRYGDGNMVWHPDDMPGPLLALALEDIPGIGPRMARRLRGAGIASVAALLATEPKHMRKLWGNVTGERLWYALHGYDIQTPPSGRGMYGHGRVLPPDHRSIADAWNASRLLLVKSARRMRRDGWNAGRLWLWLSLRDHSWHDGIGLPAVRDDQAVLAALEILWTAARRHLPRSARIIRLGVTLLELTRADERQLDIFLNDDAERRDWESVTGAIDGLNRKYGRTLVSIGPWVPPPGGYAGGKISYTRIPRAEDFW